VSKGFLRDVWHIMRDFEGYEIQFIINDWFLCEDDKEEITVYTDDIFNEVNFLLGTLNCSGYICKSNGHIRWDPNNTIPVLKQLQKVKELLKKLSEELSEEEFKKVMNKYYVQHPELNMEEEENKIIDPKKAVKYYSAGFIYDKTFEYNWDGQSQASTKSLEEDYNPKKIPLNISFFYKLNEIINFFLYTNLLFLLETRCDNDLECLISSLDNHHLDDSWYDDELEQQIYAMCSLRIKAHLLSGKCEEELLTYDAVDGSLKTLIKEREIRNNDYLPKNLRTYPIPLEQHENRMKEMGLFSKKFYENNPNASVEIEKVEKKLKSDYKGFEKLNNMSKQRLINADLSLFNKDFNNFGEEQIVKNYVNSVEIEYKIYLKKVLPNIIEIINKLEKNNKKLPDFPFKNIKRFREDFFPKLDSASRLIYHLGLGFDLHNNPTNIFFLNEAIRIALLKNKEILDQFNELFKAHRSYAHPGEYPIFSNLSKVREITLNCHKILGFIQGYCDDL